MSHLQVEQRSELVDVVTRLAKEEAAAEKGAAAAAKADAAAGSFTDMPEDVVTQPASKKNAAAARKQVCWLAMSCLQSQFGSILFFLMSI